jgi:myo-inositol catabolism protein IolH
MMRYAGGQAPARAHRRLLQPRIHQHLDIGQGEVGWDAFFGTLREIGFDGVVTACVFAWEERAKESSAFMLDRIRKELAA